MKTLIKLYVLVVLGVFGFGYLVLGVREMSLYLLLLGLNLPASAVALPASERVVGLFGFIPGSGPHVLVCLVASLALNCLLLQVATPLLRPWHEPRPGDP